MATPLTRLIGPGTTRTSQTLYDRIGGEEKLEKIVSDVYEAMKADKEIAKFFARFRLQKLKERTVDYLRGEWGGDPYHGSDLFLAHSHLGVNKHQYDIMMKCYVRTLKKEKIGKQETKEVLESLEKMRAPCVDSDLKFKEMFLKHNEREAKKNGGDGWTVISMKQSDREAKEKETLERLAQMQIDGTLRRSSQPESKVTPSLTSSDVAKEKVAAKAAPKPKAKAKPKAKPKAKSPDLSKESTTPVADDSNTHFSLDGSDVAKAKLDKLGERPMVIQSPDMSFLFSPDADAPPTQIPSLGIDLNTFLKSGVVTM